MGIWVPKPQQANLATLNLSTEPGGNDVSPDHSHRDRQRRSTTPGGSSDRQLESGPTAAIEASEDSPLDAARRKLDLLWPRLSKPTHDVLKAAASFDGPFTSEQWVAAIGVSGKTFRSHTGNIGRSLKGVDAALGSHEPKLWEWDEKGERYFLSPAMRQAIRER